MVSVKPPAVVYVVVLLALVLGACEDDAIGQPSTTGAPPTSDAPTASTLAPEPPLLKGWEQVGLLPTSMFPGWILTPVDERIIVLANDSTTVIELNGRSRTGEGPPVRVTPTPGCCGSVVGIPVEDQLVVFDAYQPATWLLDPNTTTWTQIGDRSSTGDVLGWAAIGDSVYVVTARRGGGLVQTPAEVLNTSTWEWEQIEPIPVVMSVGDVTTDGEKLFVAGVRQDSYNNLVVGNREPAVYEYADGAWSRLPDAPVDGQASTISWVAGAGLLAWNYDLESALLDAGEWESTETVPMDHQECYPHGFQVEGGVVGACGGLAFFDAASRGWSPISTSYEASYVVVGDAVYELASSGEGTRLAVHQLP